MPTRRLVALALPLCLASLAGAAEDLGDDLVLLRGGDTIRCDVVEEKADRIVVRINGSLVDLYRARIDAVQRGAGKGLPALRPRYETTDAPPPSAAPVLRPRSAPSAAGAWNWEAQAALGLGLHLGQVDSTGTIDQSGVPGTLALTFDAGSIDRLPSLQLRLAVAPTRTSARPVLGVQLSAAFPSGEGLGLSMYGAEALAGVRWGGGGKPIVELIGGLGWLMATCERELEFYSGATLLDSVDASSDLSGFGVRGEAAIRWEKGGWQYGLAAGVTWSQLSGSDTWTTNNAVFTGTEDLDASLIGLYGTAQLQVGF
jgi:hypothetical protein